MYILTVQSILLSYLILPRIILQHSQVAPDVPLQPEKQYDADDAEVIVEPLLDQS